MKFKVFVVANVDDLQDGDMKKVVLDDQTEILLVRLNGAYYVHQATCTHYGASLDEGLLSDGHICCHWHHACFSPESGACEEPPAIEALPSYEVRIEDDRVIVRMPEEPGAHGAPSGAVRRTGRDDRVFVIVGGGAAGESAARTLRREGFNGRVVMIAREHHLPYDRPTLSKAYLQGTLKPESLPLHPREFYHEQNIEVMLGTDVTGIDPAARRVIMGDGKDMAYDSLLLATGGIPRRLTVPGADLENIFTLRNRDDAEKLIRASEQASHIAVIGASFIGLETAFSFTKRGLDVTVITPESVPFQKVFGQEVGGLYRALHERNGVKFVLGDQVTAFEGNGRVREIVLASGARVTADLVVVGIGVRPATDFLDALDMDDDGSVCVDRYLAVEDSIYAAGDIARFPDWRTDIPIRIEHWRVAMQQGACAARNMLGGSEPYRGIPFFWTSQLGCHLRYAGHAHVWDDIIISGDLPAKDFIAFYIKDGGIQAAAGINRDREILAVELLMRQERMPDVGTLGQHSWGILSFL